MIQVLPYDGIVVADDQLEAGNLCSLWKGSFVVAYPGENFGCIGAIGKSDLWNRSLTWRNRPTNSMRMTLYRRIACGN